MGSQRSRWDKETTTLLEEKEVSDEELAISPLLITRSFHETVPDLFVRPLVQERTSFPKMTSDRIARDRAIVGRRYWDEVEPDAGGRNNL